MVRERAPPDSKKTLQGKVSNLVLYANSPGAAGP